LLESCKNSKNAANRKKAEAPKTHLIMKLKGVPKNVHYLITFYEIKFYKSALQTLAKSLVDRLFEKCKIMEEVFKNGQL